MSSQGQDRPRIVVLADHYLPGWRAGGPIRSLANMVEALGDRFDFRVVTRDRDHLESHSYGELIQSGWNRVGEAHVWYCTPGDMTRQRLESVLREASPDLVFANSLFSAFTRHALALGRMGRLAAPLLIAPRGELGAGALAQKRLRKQVYLRLARAAGAWHGVTWQASNAWEATAIEVRLGVAPLVATDIPERPPVAPIRSVSKSPGMLRLVFAARISPKKNLPFLLDLLPGLNGEVHLEVLGPSEESEMAIVEKAVQAVPANIAVQYRGAVPPVEVAAVVARSHFFVLPTLDENFGHSIYEALRIGRPVIVSDRTPWRDLAADRRGWDLALDRGVWETTLQRCVRMDQTEYDPMVVAAHAGAVRWFEDQQPAAQQAAVFREILHR